MDGGLRQIFREHLTDFDWVSIESGITGGGIPDSNYCSFGIEGWLEFKLATGYAISLRPEQIGWIARRCRYGGRVHVAVRQKANVGPRREARDALFLIPGRDVILAKTNGLKDAPWPVWHHGPSRWDWQAIAQILTD